MFKDSSSLSLPFILHTPRTFLRILTLSDAEAIYQLESSPEVMKYLRGPRSREESYQALCKKIGHQDQFGFSMWAIIEKHSKEWMGIAGLYKMTSLDVDIGWRLNQKYWNQGYATEVGKYILTWAFSNSNLTKIIAVSRPENISSRRVIEKLGMIYNGNINYKNRILACYQIEKCNRLTDG